ncbi:MAG TPA: hypothetical protein PLT94_17465 [Rhodocyclaceae bacterium]|nr:hypothetical protein [Rhodocyclaceae bacterium]
MRDYTFGSHNEYRIVIASERHARERALSLAYCVYLAAGLVDSRPSRMLLSCHDAIPGTVTFLVEHERDTGNSVAVASLTLIPDSELGLPLDGSHHKALSGLRATGRKPVELAKLATVAATEKAPDKGPAPRELILLHLFKVAYLAARYMGRASDLIIAVAPEQAKFFRRVLMFEHLEPDSSAPSRGDSALAVPLRLRLDTAEAVFERRYGQRRGSKNIFRFFVNETQDEILSWLRASTKPLTPADVRYLLTERSTVLTRSDEATRRLILAFYPELRE